VCALLSKLSYGKDPLLTRLVFLFTDAMKGYEPLPQTDLELAVTETSPSKLPHWRDKEKYLPRGDGRTLAYADDGNPKSSTVVLFFHHAFSVGHVSRLRKSAVLEAKDVHIVAPTLPGWGSTSPHFPSTTHASCLIGDTMALLTHLHPDSTDLKLYIVGTGFGTIPALVLYHSPFDLFPLGRHIAAILLRSPLSPAMYMQPKQRPPPLTMYLTSMIYWGMKLFMKRTLRSIEKAERGAHKWISQLHQTDREKYMQLISLHGMSEEEVVREIAELRSYSVSKSWEGFQSIRPLHSIWITTEPATLDEEHTARPILIATQRGRQGIQYLVENYRNIRAMYYRNEAEMVVSKSDEIWDAFLNLA